jgi:hypothetical protein
MNFEMADTNVQQRMTEIRSQVAQTRGQASHAANHAAGPAAHRPGTTASHTRSSQANALRRQGRPSGLRNRVGITLIEAGLHLVTADAVAQPRG